METLTEPPKTRAGYRLHKLTENDLLRAVFRLAEGKDPTGDEEARSKIFQDEEWALLLKVVDAPAEP